MAIVRPQTTHHASTIGQATAVAALAGPQGCVEEMVTSFGKRRDRFVSSLNQLPGIVCARSEGAFHAFPTCADLIGTHTPQREIINSDIDLAEYLLEHGDVATVPGSAVGAPGYLRLSFASSQETLDKARARLRRAIGALVWSP